MPLPTSNRSIFWTPLAALHLASLVLSATPEAFVTVVKTRHEHYGKGYGEYLIDEMSDGSLRCFSTSGIRKKCPWYARMSASKHSSVLAAITAVGVIVLVQALRRGWRPTISCFKQSNATKRRPLSLRADIETATPPPYIGNTRTDDEGDKAPPDYEDVPLTSPAKVAFGPKRNKF